MERFGWRNRDCVAWNCAVRYLSEGSNPAEKRGIILAGSPMGRHTLTEEEKQNGKRKFLTPLPETLAESKMHPVTREDFAALVKKAIPPSPQPAPTAK
jgi:hypothetical protein